VDRNILTTDIERAF